MECHAELAWFLRGLVPQKFPWSTVSFWMMSAPIFWGRQGALPGLTRAPLVTGSGLYQIQSYLYNDLPNWAGDEGCRIPEPLTARTSVHHC